MPHPTDRRSVRQWLSDPRLLLLLGALLVLALLAPGLVTVRGALGLARERDPEGPSTVPFPVAQAPSEPAAPQAESPSPAADRVTTEEIDADAIEPDWFALQEPPAADETPASGYECLLQPSDVVSIGSPVTGRIDRIHVERSALVEEGQIIAELEASMEKAAVEVARARAEMKGEVRSRQVTADLEKRRRQRAERLFSQNAISLDIRDEVDTQAAVAQLDLLHAREGRRLASLELAHAMAALERRTIRTPIPGIVVERLMSEGEVVDDQTILRVARLDPLWVEAVLPAARFGTVRVGMRGAVTPEVPGDTDQIAAVVNVDRVIDPASGTFSVRLALENPEYEIPSGLHCRVRFLED
jgi:RND family efflux transporter MFP subunit